MSDKNLALSALVRAYELMQKTSHPNQPLRKKENGPLNWSLLSLYYFFSYLSCIARKPAFGIYETKGADQPRGSYAADQHLSFHCILIRR